MATSCVHHMKQNVSTRYVKLVAEFIFPLVKSYSTVYQGSGKMATMIQLHMSHDAVHTHMTKDIDHDQPAKGRETSNVILVHE